MRERMTAIRVSITDITDGEYRKEDGGQYVRSPHGVELRRVALVGYIVEKRSGKGEKGTYANITIDDSTGTIKAWTWDINVGALEQVQTNILALIIGKVKAFSDGQEVYILPEIVREIDDPNHMTLHILERYRTILAMGGTNPDDLSIDTASLTSTTPEKPKESGKPKETTRQESLSTAAPTGKLEKLILQYMQDNPNPDGFRIEEIADHFVPMGHTKADINLEIVNLQAKGAVLEQEIGRYILTSG
ncbi:MAG: hypothetical protein RTU92_15005 [Candidatus Thorarchaeota archaeon]